MRWALVVVACGCVSPPPFVCRSSAECATETVAGTCEPVGLCSFPDLACSTSRRFGEHAGDVAGLCVTDGPSTFFVRADGGSAEQCDGRVDGPVSADGHCAWAHPFLALPPGGTPRLASGDRLLIGPGEYRMGVGAPGAEACPAADPASCVMAPPPDGVDAAHPTQLLGADCASPPLLLGAGGAPAVVELGGASFVELGCLEISDGAVCGRGFVAAPCSPGGEWADAGVHAAGGSALVLRQLDVHGMADDGLALIGVRNLVVEDTRVAQNAGAGVSLLGDGTLASNEVVVDGLVADTNGCVEALPATFRPQLCAQQPGTGLGLVGVVGDGAFTITGSTFTHNSLHGVELSVRTGGGAIRIERSQARGNAGIGFWVTGAATLTNNVVVGDCGAFQGKPFAGNVQPCRGEVAIRLGALDAAGATLRHNTVYGQGRCLLGLNGAGQVNARNNVFLGGPSLVVAGAQACLDRSDPEATLDHDYGVLFGTQGTACPLGAHDLCVDPRLVDAAPDTFDAHLQPGSPALDSGVPLDAAVAFDGTARPAGSGVDRGAYEQ